MKKRIIAIIFLAVIILIVSSSLYLVIYLYKIRNKEDTKIDKKSADNYIYDIPEKIDVDNFLTGMGVFGNERIIGTIDDFKVNGLILNYFLWKYYLQDFLYGDEQESIGKTFSMAEDKITTLLYYRDNYKGGGLTDEYLTIDKVKEIDSEYMTALDVIQRDLMNKISYEAISIWFYNIDEPDMGIEEAKKIAELKINDLYSKLQSGEIESLKDAGDRIKSDSSLEDINPAYIGNAYRKIENESFYSLGNTFSFNNSEFLEALKSQPLDYYSEVVVLNDGNDDNPLYPSRFEVFRVTGRTSSGYNSIEELLNFINNTYEINWIR